MTKTDEGSPSRQRAGAFVCLGAGLLVATAGVALAQTASAPAAPQYNLNVPMFSATGSDPYSFSATPAPNTNSGSIPAPPATLPDGYNFDAFRKNIHGYVSAGIATHNGHNFSGEVEMPLVPGKADLAVGATSGQIGGFAPYLPGGKTSTLRYDQYYAALHLHPADDVDAYIAVTGGQLHFPSTQVP